jgi:hypothetical protein
MDTARSKKPLHTDPGVQPRRSTEWQLRSAIIDPQASKTAGHNSQITKDRPEIIQPAEKKPCHAFIECKIPIIVVDVRLNENRHFSEIIQLVQGQENIVTVMLAHHHLDVEDQISFLKHLEPGQQFANIGSRTGDLDECRVQGVDGHTEMADPALHHFQVKVDVARQDVGIAMQMDELATAPGNTDQLQKIRVHRRLADAMQYPKLDGRKMFDNPGKNLGRHMAVLPAPGFSRNRPYTASAFQIAPGGNLNSYPTQTRRRLGQAQPLPRIENFVWPSVLSQTPTPPSSLLPENSITP